ncbi:eukaryotic translation initiation factor 3 subunit D [Paracoccidioides brasiliensis]|uniref:Eukaryotic translation initiation factor 3 subunit D n=1 Tax=Paracoccidioides brasiliensis TaxID=121759 RepID=A0A1D2JPN5_PARBR|nr:eukaryotic translation initiation factor 3 subunit D [Paracoccidioides brasiliensis]
MKSLGAERTTTRGQPQKRRGPKPDSKPAQTRRQELNRQAQRTHRERKEQYIRALETEVSRLRECYSNDMSTTNLSMQQQKKILQEQKDENAMLRQLLTAHGVPFEAELERRRASLRSGNNRAYTSASVGRTTQAHSQSHSHVPSHSHSQGFTGGGNPPTSTPSTIRSAISPGTGSDSAETQPGGNMFPLYSESQGHQKEQSGVLAESSSWGGDGTAVDDVPGIFEKDPQLGVDFILSLEQSCRTHMELLCRRAEDDEEHETISGHVLMASCPPPTQIISAEPGQMYSTRTYDLPHANLTALLNLSRQLVTGGQITPIMALQYLKSHDTYPSLTREDVRHMMDDLNGKIRCYGFGAVMEDFEFMDSFSSVLARKMEPLMDTATSASSSHDDDDASEKGQELATMALTSITDIVASLPSGDSWGPPVTSESTLDGVPYAPFSKGDKLGRMADWATEGKDGRDGRGGRQAYNRVYRDQQVYGAGTSSLFSVQVAEDESSFSVVDNTRSSTKTRGFGRGGGTIFRGRGQRGGSGQRGRSGFQRVGAGRGGQPGGDRYYDNRGGRGGRGRRFGWRDYDKPQRNRDSSVHIRSEWTMREEIDFTRLSKLNLETPDGEDIDNYGFLYYYDRAYDKPPVRNTERKLISLDRAAYNVTTTADPIIQELAEKDEATVFATADILSMLMCAPRSVYSWDIVIIQQGNKIYLDKRDNASIDLVTVNENAADAPLEASEAGGNKQDSINTPSALAIEATVINHNFALQTVIESETSKFEFSHPNPFYNPSEETEPLASKGYKYRRFDLSLEKDEEPLHLIVRTEVDAVVKNNISGDDQQLTLKALNEFDHKSQGAGGALDWRTKLVSQRGAVVATEMKNNSCKLARWATQAILAKADTMKLGFVSRANPKSASAHIILGVVGYKPREFAAQMNLNLSNGWGIVRTIVDLVRGLEHDDEEENDMHKFVLVKDPNKPVIRLYQIPVNTFEEDEDAAETVKEDKEDESEDEA